MLTCRWKLQTASGWTSWTTWSSRVFQAFWRWIGWRRGQQGYCLHAEYDWSHNTVICNYIRLYIGPGESSGASGINHDFDVHNLQSLTTTEMVQNRTEFRLSTWNWQTKRQKHLQLHIQINHFATCHIHDSNNTNSILPWTQLHLTHL